MTTKQELDAVAQSTVFDSEGEKVGKVEQVYIDDQNSLPTWVSVKTGWFSSSSLVPLAGAKHRDERLDVPVTKQQVKDAPHLDADDGISAEQGDELLRYYGLTKDTSGWDTYGKHAGGTTDQGTEPAAGAAGTGVAGGVGAATGGNDTATPDAAPSADESLVRSEERLNVGTERVATGKARLRKYVVTEDQTVTVPVSREEVRVVREPIDGQVSGADIGDGEAEVTLHEDKVVANKETVPVERVGLAVNEVTGEESVSDTVRKEQVETEGIDTPKK